MESFILFLLIVCVVVLFNNFSKLKKENEYLDSLYKRNKEDFHSLKKEMEEIKKQITQPDFVPEKLTSKVDEVEIIPEVITPVISEQIPIADSISAIVEDNFEEELQEKSVFVSDSTTIPIHYINNEIEEKETVIREEPKQLE